MQCMIDVTYVCWWGQILGESMQFAKFAKYTYSSMPKFVDLQYIVTVVVTIRTFSLICVRLLFMLLPLILIPILVLFSKHTIYIVQIVQTIVMSVHMTAPTKRQNARLALTDTE